MARFRFQAGTDSARIGIWDARFTSAHLDWDAVDDHLANGSLFYVALGGDGGGPVEVFVDEPIPPALLGKVRTINRRFLLHIESGRASVGGVEDFGGKKPSMSFELPVPPGDWAVRCHTPDLDLDGAHSTVPLEGPLADRLLYEGVAVLAMIGSAGLICAGCAVFIDAQRWWVKLGVLGMLLGFVLAWLVSRTPGYKRMAKQAAQRREDAPPIIFELTPKGDEELEGGFVNL